MRNSSLSDLLEEVRACRLCEEHLADGVRPVLKVRKQATILVAGQAPGRRVHASGLPFDDPSGDRLRDWMGITRETFYGSPRIAIIPMGFCYPGTGKSGDLPPRPECAVTWRKALVEHLTGLKLTLVIGQYAMRWHLATRGRSVTETVRAWKSFRPAHVPLPHPSFRNNLLLRQNVWFEMEVVPYVRRRVRQLLDGD